MDITYMIYDLNKPPTAVYGIRINIILKGQLKKLVMIKKNELYDLKYHISDYITPRLLAYKQEFDKGESPSSKVFRDKEKEIGRELSYEESVRFWSDILEDMIFPFEYLHNPEKHEKLSNNEVQIKTKKGLELFLKYFEDLWM